ncbi:V-type ATP synthase subunit C [Tetragenococcus muriaticus PMC-11-5]|uniref:V-type ATP synthase subunit C n=2 Tax=Tetragenococcus muriaticus TaxID=64642 RepID=A0A091C6H7_9ENTE|nr:V-type ATP synthase subunit C [Tetragenococcus muriaticus]KFN93416.1 V-type ATP synthase subunit C [Tetragenococcus muriaticus PMC-11-5]GMA46182.1 V-type ATPase subunit C [Tetragenococcus muriaticus]GMA48485.1 V-type ATPase subunit C [Tetragenococcus muriaticus]
MDDIQFSSANVRIRTYESRLLTKNTFDRMMAAEEAEDSYSILQETTYGDFIEDEDEVRDFEQVLIAEKKRTFDLVYNITPVKSIVDLMALQYDYQNLKVLVKQEYTQEDFSEFLVPMGSLPLSVLKELVNVRRSNQVDPIMNRCIEEVFQYIEDYDEIQAVDIIFDNYYWDHMVNLSQSENNENIERLVQRNIDVFNISTTLRSYLMGQRKGFINAVLQKGGTLDTNEMVEGISASLENFMDYMEQTSYQNLVADSYDEITQNKKLTSLDLNKDNFLMRRLKEEKTTPFGPQAILGYLYAKEVEIKNLRMILVGKINKIPEETLQERVRESYV